MKTWLESMGQDLRYGVRGLRRSPGFAVAAITLLALGIGANTAIFSLFRAVVLRPLPFPDPLTFAGTAVLLGVVALAATALPAFRGASVNPSAVLRSE